MLQVFTNRTPVMHSRLPLLIQSLPRDGLVRGSKRTIAMTQRHHHLVQDALFDAEVLELLDVLGIHVTFPIVQVAAQFLDRTGRTGALSHSPAEQLVPHRTERHLRSADDGGAILVHLLHLIDFPRQFKPDVSASRRYALGTTHNVTRSKHVPPTRAERLEKQGEVVQRHAGRQSGDVHHIVMTEEHFVGGDVSRDEQPVAQFGRRVGPQLSHPAGEDAFALGAQHPDRRLSHHRRVVDDVFGL
mmetsp:Transcript_19505/g.31909  ORF Transcript_19505/g.31909 Transcript_19505/m.31909 type:complete len:244 (+) Transcript_19505:226-957(+)